tara:strand:- start:1628 stop:2101 length:474 start_codon:yes stop_codon:yes gene_type:complete
MIINGDPVPQTPGALYYVTNPYYQPHTRSNIYNENVYFKWFVIYISLDIFLKVSLVVYSPLSIIHITLAFFGFIGAYYTKMWALVIYIFYQFVCVGMGLVVIVGVAGGKVLELHIDGKYWYIIPCVYVSESIIMIAHTSKLISKVAMINDISQPFIT